MIRALNRREFLGHSAAAGAALAVWSEVSAAQTTLSANDQLVAAVMGTNVRCSA